MKTTLEERLREVMKELGIASPRELANFCGVSEGLVSQWFKGSTKLGPKPLIAFARTKFSLDWIVDGKPPKYSTERQHLTIVKPPAASPPISGDDAIELLTLFEAAGVHERKMALRALRPAAEKNGLRWRRIRDDQS